MKELPELHYQEVPIHDRDCTTWWVSRYKGTKFRYSIPPNVTRAVVVLPPESQFPWVLATRVEDEIQKIIDKAIAAAQSTVAGGRQC